MMTLRRPRGRPRLGPELGLSSLQVFVRLDAGRAAVVAEVARHCGIDNPEMIRRMIDFWIQGHNPAPAPATPRRRV